MRDGAEAEQNIAHARLPASCPVGPRLGEPEIGHLRPRPHCVVERPERLNHMKSELGILDPSILQEYWGRDQLNAWIGNLSTVILTPNINSYV